jgi:hypothetical protein
VNGLADREAAIRHWLDAMDKPRPTAARYAMVAARWEQLRLAQARGRTTPADDTRLRELAVSVQAFGETLGLGPNITVNGYLPGDPGRIISQNWRDNIEDWF